MSKFLSYGNHGAMVKRLQRLLNDNPFHKIRPLAVDGEMGPLTCAAIHHVKRFAGYENLDPDLEDQIAGDFFFDLLEKKRQLPPEYAKRRRTRLAAAKKKPMRVKALRFAEDDLGVREVQVNIIKYNEWWCGGGNDHAPYCVRAGSYWYKKAGSTIIDPAAGRFQGTDYFLACARQGQFGLHLTADPQPGDAFVIDFDGHSDPDHFGLFVKDLDQGEFHAIEANATFRDGSGQGVDYHTRAARNCWFVEINK